MSEYFLTDQIPTLLCVDNFYDDPDEVRKFALEQTFDNTNDYSPGIRTRALNEINEVFFNSFCDRLFSLYFDFEYSETNWFVYTNFQKIYPFNEDENSQLNRGWIHTDFPYVAAGVIYLNPKSNPNSGTSFYSPKDDEKVDIDYNIRNKFYKDRDESDLEEYLSEHSKHEKYFINTIKISNVYNRMIFYNGNYWHRENCFVSGFGEPRLTQTFFISNIESESFPLERMRNYEIKF